LGEPITLPYNTGSPSDTHKNVRWYKKEALKYLTARTLELSKELSAIRGENLKPKQVKIRSYRSRWGTCSRDNTITYNWRVIMAKPEAITYLVAHELSHIVHKNHSHRFYSVLEKLDPDYKTHRKLLRTSNTY